jgi:hypothetical protein
MGLANRRLQSCAPATAIEEEVEATQALLAKLCVQLEAAPSDAALAILRAYKEKLQESIKAMVPQTRLLELPAELLVVVIQQLLNTGDGACGALWPSSSSPPWPDGSSRTPYPRDLSSAVERGYRRVGRLAQYRTVQLPMGHPHASAPAARAYCVRDGLVCTVLASVRTNMRAFALNPPSGATPRAVAKPHCAAQLDTF